MVTIRVPPDGGKALALFSVKVKAALPAEVPPTGTVPADATEVDASATGATIVAASEATSDTARPSRMAFFMAFTDRTLRIWSAQPMGHPYWGFRAPSAHPFLRESLQNPGPSVRSNLHAGLWKDAELITRFNLEPFASPGYRRYFLATALVALALWIYQPALEWIVLIETGRAAAVGLLQTALIVSIALATLPSGLLTARYGPRRTLTASILGLAGMVGLIALVAAVDRLTFEVALVLSFATGLFDGLFSVPAALLVAQVVAPRFIGAAIGLSYLTSGLGRLVGGPLGGTVLQLAGPVPAFLPAALILVVAASVVFTLPGPATPTTRSSGGGRGDLRAAAAVAPRQQADPGRHSPWRAVRSLDLRLLRAPAGFHAGRAAGRTRDPRPAERCRRRGLDRRSAGHGADGPATRTRTPGRGDVRRLGARRGSAGPDERPPGRAGAHGVDHPAVDRLRRHGPAARSDGAPDAASGRRRRHLHVRLLLRPAGRDGHGG